MSLYIKHSTRYIYHYRLNVMIYIVNTYIQYSIQFFIGTEAHYVEMCIKIHVYI